MWNYSTTENNSTLSSVSLSKGACSKKKHPLLFLPFQKEMLAVGCEKLEDGIAIWRLSRVLVGR
jgi:hypothetical protein